MTFWILTKLESNKLTLTNNKFSLKELANSAITNSSSLIEDKDIMLHANVSEAIPEYVWGR